MAGLARTPSPTGLMPRSSRGLVATGVLFSAYAIANVVAWWGKEPVLTWDSGRYAGGDIFLFLNPGITPTVLFSMTSSLQFATFVQVVVYILAWLSLSVAVLVSLRDTWIKWPLVVVSLLLSLTSPLWNWNLVVGSEGLTVSALVLWISILIRFATRTNPRILVIGSLVAAFLMVTRPQMLIFVVPIQVVATVWWMRRHALRLSEPRRALAVALAVLVAGTGWAIYRAALLASDDVYSFRYALHNLVEKTPSFREYVLREAPPCDAIPAALNGPQPWTDVIALDQTLISLCPETYLWFKSDAVSPQTWIAYNPAAAALNFRDVMWGIALPVGAEESFLPKILDDALLPVHNVWLAIAVGLAVGLLLGFVGGVRIRVTGLGVAGLLVSIGAVTVYLFGVWVADGYDVIRHMVPVTTLLPVAALVLPSALTGTRSSD